MGTVHFLLGGNSGNRSKYLESAISMIEEAIGSVKEKSSVYQTEPWGFNAATAFLNQVIRVDTALSPRETLHRTKEIEAKLGRLKRSDAYESRVIDIDILMFDDLRVEDHDLQIPHPRMHLRKFTLVPLAEIAGSVLHPVLKLDMNALKRACQDKLKVEMFNKPLI